MSDNESLALGNFSTICRTCLQHYDADSLLSINEIYLAEGEIRLMDVLLKYTEMEENENYPKKICAACLAKAETSYSFFAKCNESDLILSQSENDHNQEVLDMLDNSDDELDETNEEDGKFEIIKLVNDENQENMEIKIILDEDEDEDIDNEDIDDEDSSQMDSSDDKFTIDHAASSSGNNFFVIEKCKFCSMELEALYMEEHKSRFGHYNNSKRIRCPHCNIITRNITSFKQHLRKYHNHRKESKKYFCELCSKVFKWNKNYVEHLKNHNLNPEEKVICPECGLLLGNLTALQIHKVKEHTPIVNELWTCRHCSEVFKPITEFKKHLRDIHSEKDFYCIICGKDCQDKRTLYYHEQLHLDEYGIECTYCHKKLLTEEKLILHQRIHKYVKKKHICSFCNKGFKQLDKLEAHERIHTGEKPYTCEECGKAFNHQNNLMHHKRLHTGATPYKCLFCSKGFSNSHTLRKHMSNPKLCVTKDAKTEDLSMYLV